MAVLRLTNENIDIIISRIRAHLLSQKVDSKRAVALALSAEEMLLNFQSFFGSDKQCEYIFSRRFGKTQIKLKVRGLQYKPFDNSDETVSSEIMDNLLHSIGRLPDYSFADGENVVVFTAERKKLTTVVKMMLAMGSALAAGLLFRFIAPADICTAVTGGFMQPIYDCFIGMINAVSGPLIFLSVVWGIYSIGDTATLGRVGSKLISRFIIDTILVTLIGLVIMLPFFNINYTPTASGSGAHFSELYKLILNIIPNNIVQPFVDNNPMQIIFLAICTGLSLIVLGRRLSAFARLLGQLNSLAQYVMETVGKIIPYAVFISVFIMSASSRDAGVLSAAKMIPVQLLAAIIAMAIIVSFVCLRMRITPVQFVKKTFATMIISATTASSSAAYTANINDCRNNLGVDEKLVRFGVPFGQVVFMPIAAQTFLCAALCGAEYAKIDVSFVWIIIAVLFSAILAVAVPPIPSGAISCFAILFMQLGIPTEFLTIVMALDIFLDMIDTPFDLMSLQAELVIVGNKLGMVDKKLLRAHK